MRFKGLSIAAAPLTPVAPRLIPHSAESAREVTNAMRVAEADLNSADLLVEDSLRQPDAEVIHAPDAIASDMHNESSKLSKLMDDDFPFDPSQLAAIDGLASQQYGCMTGAAGTGKTTCTKAIVDRIKDSLGEVDMSKYFRKGKQSKDEFANSHAGDNDDYEMPEGAIPSICLVGFTGRSTQMIKKNFPRDWHPNIMTIHRCLGFAPEFYEDLDDYSQIVTKMRFTPTYNANLRLPWDVIIIDEAGMLGIPLWDQLWAALKPGCRVLMIGDINQLPPVHGRSIFGFALSQWPAYELNHIHRQEGVNNSIVDGAWSILKGYKPKSDLPGLSLGDSTNSQASKEAVLKTLKALSVRDDSWKFAMVAIPEDADVASQRIRKVLQLLNGKSYDPIHDSVVTAINGHDGSRGINLGQIPMNRELAIVLNPDAPRYIIDGGRERKQFAVGDKVMATKNDYEAGITNGMTGIITAIERNGGYAGDSARFGLVSEVNEYFKRTEDEPEEDISLDDMADSYDDYAKGREDAKEGRDRGPASHIITVRFGEGDHAFDILFASLSEVASLMTAYVVTCHKMQGGESPMVMTIMHQSHKSMLYREWAYTAITRASQHCVVFYNDLALRVALNKQKIVGKTLQEKVRVFQQLAAEGPLGKAVDVRLPESHSLSKALAILPDRMGGGATPVAVASRGLALSAAPDIASDRREERQPTVIQPGIESAAQPEAPRPDRVVFRDRVIIIKRPAEPEVPAQPIDMGYATHVTEAIPALIHARNAVMPVGPVWTHSQASRPAPLALPAPAIAPASTALQRLKRFGVKA